MRLCAWLVLLLGGCVLAEAALWREAVVFYAAMDGKADASVAGGAPQARLFGPTSFAPGRKGQALALPEGAGCSYAAPGNFPREQGTFCAWVCLSRDSAVWDSKAGSWWQWLLGVRDKPDLPAQRSDLRLFFDQSLTLQFATPTPVPTSGMAAVPDIRWARGTWHHVGVTYRGREIQLYVDGEPREQPLTTCDPLAGVGERMLLGGSDEAGHNSLGGLVDEVYLLSRPVTAAEMKTIYLATGALADDSGGVRLPEPLLAATLDGTTAARVAGLAARDAQGSGLEFTNWQRGQALLVQRRAYDNKASCAWLGVPGPLPERGTALLWVKPAGAKPWDGTERGVRRPLLTLRSGPLNVELTRSAQQQLALAVRGPATGQAAFDVVRWNAMDSHQVAATWDGPARSLALFVDGRRVASGTLTGSLPAAGGACDVWLGADDADRYTGDTADAAFRDLRLYREVLTADQIAAVANGREGVPLQPLGLAGWPPATHVPAWNSAFDLLSSGVCEYAGQPVAAGPQSATVLTAPLHFSSETPAAGPRTVAVWFKLPARTSMSPTSRVLSLRFRSPEGATATFEDDALSQRLTPAVTDGVELFGGTPSLYRLCADAWHQIALVCAPSGTSYYLDGVLQAQGDKPLTLGALQEVSAAAGQPPAEVVCWSRALSETEVQRLFNFGAAAFTSPALLKDAEKPYWDLTTAHRDSAEDVDRVCLNALWRFLPADGIMAAPPTAWGYARLPGSFSAVHLWKLYDQIMKPLPGEDWTDGRGFTRWNEPRYDAGWYERLVTVPAGWQGRRITLRFDHLAAYVARVLVDGELRGHFEQTKPGEALLYPPRVVDVSDCAGKTIRVSLQIGWDNAGAGDFEAVSDSWLAAESGWVDITNVTPTTRVEPAKSLAVRALLHNAGTQPASVTADARVMDRDREALPLAGQLVTLAPGETREVAWEAPWPGARLWSPDDPYLYQLVTRLREGPGGQVLKEQRQRLGLREFGIRGREFVLNGKPVHLRGTNTNLPYAYPITDPAYLRTMYEKRKALGFNCIQYWSDPSVAAMGGQSWTLDQMLDWCDEMGFIALVGNVSHLQEVKDEATYGATVDGFIRRYGAHAAVCMWFVNPNTCWYNYGMHPQNLDCRYEPVAGEPGFDNRALALVGERTVRDHDPQGRPVFTYASGNFGALYSAMQYMSLGLPLQEEADWPAAWAESAPKPLLPVETDLKWTPHWADFEAYERSAQDQSPTPMYYVEHAARYLGDAPYAQVTHPGVDSLSFRQPNGDTEWNRLEDEPYVLQVRALAAREILRGWRGYGMSGVTFHAEEDDLMQSWAKQAAVFPPRSPAELQTPGAKPELKYQWFPRYLDFTKPNQPYYDAFARNFSPVLAFIGGTTLEPERKLGDFTACDHAYYAGETVSKQMVVINDRTDRDLMASGEWRVTDAAGKPVASGAKAVQVASGARACLPFSFAAPAVTGRTELRLGFTLREGQTVVAEDSLDLQVFPRPATAKLGAAVALVDTVDGATAKALQAGGIAFVKATSASDLAAAKTIVVGQGALAEAGGGLLAAWERGGGLQRGANVLVLAQPPTPLLNLIFEPAYERYVWPRAMAHPVLQGLRAADLANWRGYSTLSPAYAPPDPAGKFAPHYPGLKWHWGNRGMVATWPLRKPTYGNFRVLADDGFDLALSPLLEWLDGPSRVVLCQLDLVSRSAADPVATDLLRRLCGYVSDAPAPRWVTVSYTGGEAGRRYLAPHQVQDAARVADDGVLISDGEGQGTLTALQGHLDRGGTVVLINPGSAALQTLGLTGRDEKVWHAALPAGDWPLLSGVSPADLYWRQERTMTVLTDLPAGAQATTPAVIAEVPHGRGRLIVCTANASLYDDLRATYVNNRFGTARAYYARTSNADKLHRALSQMLTNLGVAQRHPQTAVFAGEYGQNGKLMNPVFRIPLPQWQFAIDPGDRGRAQGWAKPEFDDRGWKPLRAPGMWQDQGINDENPGWPVEDPTMKRPYNGIAWYRVKVTVSAALRGRELFFDSGGIDDYDEVYCNGQLVGQTGKETPSWWAVPRHYRLPAEVLRYGAENVIAVRVTDTGGGGGFAGKEQPRLQAPPSPSAFSPYLEDLSDYDINGFHNW